MRDSDDSYALDRDAEASPKNSVALGITALLVAFFLRKHFLEHGYCREYEELREHLLIANRKLTRVKANGMTELRADVPGQYRDPAFANGKSTSWRRH